MRILWLTDFDDGVIWNQNFVYERKAFGRFHDVFCWGRGFSYYDQRMTAQDVSQSFGPFDVVICSEFFLYTQPLAGLIQLPCPKLALLCDPYLHAINMRRASWKRDGVSGVMHRYLRWNDDWQAAFPGMNWLWQPWAVDPDVFYPTDVFRSDVRSPAARYFDIALLGNTSSHLYPERKRLLDALSCSGLKVLTSPGNANGMRYGVPQRDPQAVIGRDYVKLWHSAKVGVATGGKPQFAVGKYVEIAGAGCALAGEFFDEIEELGFVPDDNMIALSPDPVQSIALIRDVVQDHFHLADVAQRGMNLVYTRHTWDHRVHGFNAWFDGCYGSGR